MLGGTLGHSLGGCISGSWGSVTGQGGKDFPDNAAASMGYMCCPAELEVASFSKELRLRVALYLKARMAGKDSQRNPMCIAITVGNGDMMRGTAQTHPHSKGKERET